MRIWPRLLWNSFHKCFHANIACENNNWCSMRTFSYTCQCTRIAERFFCIGGKMFWRVRPKTDYKLSSTEPVFVDLLWRPGIDSQPGGPVRQPYFSYRPARLHRLAKSVPRNRVLGSINVYKYGLGIAAVWYFIPREDFCPPVIKKYENSKHTHGSSFQWS